MDQGGFRDKLIARVEAVTVTALQLLVILLVVVGTLVLFVLFVRNLLDETIKIDSVAGLLPAMQRSFAGVLIVVLGLELLETLRAFFSEHHIRLEVILVVAIMAVGRHVIQVDFEHTPGTVLLGLSAIIIALTSGYFLLKKAQAGGADAGPPSATATNPDGREKFTQTHGTASAWTEKASRT